MSTPVVTPSSAPARPAGHRLWFPIIVTLVVVAANFVPTVWHQADLDTAPLMYIWTVSFMLIPVGVLLVLAWLLTFSRYRWRTKLTAVAALALVAGGGVASVRGVEFNGAMVPIPVWRWESSAAERLAEFQARQAQARPAELPAIDVTVNPRRDFPRYRGKNADGTFPGRNLPAEGLEALLRRAWQHPCGGGYSGFAVAGNVLVTAEQRGGNEAVVCYDQDTALQRWAYEYPALFSEKMGGDGPRATPTIADGDVYSLGATGELVCLDGKTGELHWKVNILEDNKAKNLDWGMAGSPLVLGDKVIVTPGIDEAANAKQAVAAYDRKTGKRLWAAGEHKAGYSSPQRAELLGVEQVLVFDSAGLAGLDPADGRELWRFPWKSAMDMNIIQPVVIGNDRVFISSGVSEGGAMLRLGRPGDGWKAEELWRNRSLCSGFSNPIAHKGFIYGLSNQPGPLVCLDQETGQRRWREGRFGSGQLLLVGENLVVFSETGEMVVVKADPEGYQELVRKKVSEHRKNWNTPAFAPDQFFLRNHTDMVCVDVFGASGGGIRPGPAGRAPAAVPPGGGGVPPGGGGGPPGGGGGPPGGGGGPPGGAGGRPPGPGAGGGRPPAAPG
jgi:outer membrane protein assembly factor BamB